MVEVAKGNEASLSKKEAGNPGWTDNPCIKLHTS